MTQKPLPQTPGKEGAMPNFNMHYKRWCAEAPGKEKGNAHYINCVLQKEVKYPNYTTYIIQ